MAMIRCSAGLALCFLLFPGFALAQQSPPTSLKPAEQQPDSDVVPGDWAPELLDAILSSPNDEAQESLLDAAFSAGPAIVPQLEAALKDDRTAEFAAQSLAFIGGENAFATLAGLVNDPRDLNLRRFFYGALGESASPQATQALIDLISGADAEPDRTVTEAAIIALTVRADPGSIPALRLAAKQVKDPVIRDDVDNAREVIDARARYLASPEGKKEGVSVERAVRTYFYPALKSAAPAVSTTRPAAQRTSKPAAPAPAPPPEVKVEIRRLTLSPDKSRALAHVVFEEPSALANYDMVLQKRLGDWIIASVWLGIETEKAPATGPASAGP